jgi:hypothetical protein
MEWVEWVWIHFSIVSPIEDSGVVNALPLVVDISFGFADYQHSMGAGDGPVECFVTVSIGDPRVTHRHWLDPTRFGPSLLRKDGSSPAL